MGLGKMLAGLFKKDETEAPRAENAGSHDGLSQEPGHEDIVHATAVDGHELSESAGPVTDDGNEMGNISPVDGAADLPSAIGSSHPEVTESKILEVLSNVYDPEIPIDIVNLGLVYGIDIEGGNVRISMTMTAPGCPASTQIAGESKILVEEIPGVENVEIELVWDPPWDPSKMSDDARQSMGIF